MSRREAAIACAVIALGIAGCRTPVTPLESDPETLRSPAAGDLVGGAGRYGAHVWRGIPYAVPPVAELRWRAPRPPAPWSGVREARVHGSSCPQLGSSIGGPRGAREGVPAGGEDCLTLDVYAPRWSRAEVPGPGAAVPVLFWIHGGSNVIGTGAFYDGGNLASTHDVVVVSINYRLGPFGWMRHAALRDGADAADASGNYGTLDIIRALEWVRDNVGAFGGDPGNVTIFGESAGGQNVFSLLLSPLARGLFHRAIVQSGGLWMDAPAQAENFIDDTEPGDSGSSQEVLLQLLQQDGAAADRDGARSRLLAMSHAEIERYMRSKSVDDWLGVYGKDDVEGLSQMPKVFGDGFVLPSEPALEVFRRGDHNHVPLIVGTNRDENKLFFFTDERLVRRWFGWLPRVRDARLYDAAAEHVSAIWKAAGADVPASAIASVQQEGVYLYRWDWDEEPTIYGANLSQMLGAAHGLEIPFVFGHFDLGKDGNVLFTEENAPGRASLSRSMMSYWAEFAHSGAPGQGRAEDLPGWTAWDTDGPRFIVFDTEADGGIRHEGGFLTEADVVARVEQDQRLRDQRERCSVLYALVGWGDYDVQDYPGATGERCAAYPYDAFPW